jgi:asparagine synthase (glutamine-hydrolysing)
MTRQYVTVALSGDGGDELFGGYRRYRFAVAEEQTRQWMPAWMRRSVVKTMAAWYPKLDFAPRPLRAKATLESLSLEFGQAYFESMTGLRFGFYERILSSQLRRDLGGYSPCSSFVDRFRKYSHLPPLQQLEAVDLETYLPGDILVKIDRATMAYSLEGRCPLLDYRLGDLACRMPGSFKLRAGVGKYIFKQMMRPHLPGDVLDRSKMGFAVPLQEWFRSTLKPVFEGLVLRPAMERYFDLGAVRDIWKSHQGGQRNHGRDLWILLMLACWDDRYGHDRSGELLTGILAATKG